ncbi:MAG: glycosyltransferase family 4 protein [Sphingobacteriaceae bacterium]
MKCAISHPNIAPYIKQSVLAYQEYGVLDKFYTTYFEHPDYPFTQKLIRLFPKFEKEFKRRNISEIDYAHVKGFPYREMLRVFTARLLSPQLMNRVWNWTELNFDEQVASQLNNQIQWVHTYEHAALATIRQAKKLQITSFHEQPSQHYTFFNHILQQQLTRYPQLISPATHLLNDERAVKQDQRKNEELKACDYVICNSMFTLKTLTDAGVNDHKIIRIPYGFPETVTNIEDHPVHEKITFLYAGSQSIRKGLHILYEAWKRCDFDPDKAELIIIGKNQLPQAIRSGLSDTVKFINNLPHPELMDFYHKADVFVLPTLADGFGMVISEAMSMGVPVLTTRNSGGPDIINHQENGLLVEAGDAEALAQQMMWCFQHPQQVKEMGEKALATAKAYPWSMFRKKLMEEVLNRVDVSGHD